MVRFGPAAHPCAVASCSAGAIKPLLARPGIVSFCSFQSIGYTDQLQPTQSTAFNLSLDKWPETRYSLVKVLLTVSPFGPPFSLPLNPFPRSPRSISPLSTVFTPIRPLTPLSTAFTQKHRGVGYKPNNSALAFLCDLCGKFIVLILLQTVPTLLTFFSQRRSFLFNTLHTLLQKHRGWVTSALSAPQRCHFPSIFYSLVFIPLQIPFSACPPRSIFISFIFMHVQTPWRATPLLAHLYKTPGVCGPRCFILILVRQA